MYRYGQTRTKQNERIKGIFVIGLACIVLFAMEYKEQGFLLGKELTKAGMESAVSYCMPLLDYANGTEKAKNVEERILTYFFPVLGQGKKKLVYETEVESVLSYEQILALEAADEKEISQSEGNDKEMIVSDQPEEENVFLESPVAVIIGKAQKVMNYSREKLCEFDYLIQNFYRIDKTTTISGEQLNAKKMLDKDMTLSHDANTPQILIYHTHSQEGYVDSIAGDSSTTVVGVGEYLTKLLRENYGLNVLHHTGEYDVISRDNAYSDAGPAVEKILKDNPGIEVVIDLHRDGVGEDTRLLTTIDGVEMAKIMFVNGLSRTTGVGNISYLYNPYLADNLAFSFQMQLAVAEYYPGLSRGVYLKGYRYNLHYCPKSLLVEVGAQTNTLQEAMNAMVPLADAINKVLTGAEE